MLPVRTKISGPILAVNSFGNVIDPHTGNTIAGARRMPEGDFIDPLKILTQMPASFSDAVKSTSIGIVVTNATISKEAANKVAQMAHNGLARTIRPAFTLLDGDTCFALSAGKVEIDLNIVGAYAAQVYQEAILNAVKKAEKAGGIPAMK